MNAGAARFRKWRERNKLTQRDVSKELEIQSTKVSDYERCRMIPSLPVAVRIQRLTRDNVRPEHWVKQAKNQRRAR